MTRLPLVLTLTVSAITLTACGEDATQPTTPVDQTPQPSFTLASNTWTPKAPLPYGPSQVSAAIANDPTGQSILYVFGGQIDEGTGFNVQAYNPATDTWTQKTTSISEYATNGVGKIGNKLYYSGGYQVASYPIAYPLLYSYDFAADRLVRKADMPKATTDGVTGVIDNKLYVLPGWCSGEFWPSSQYCDVEPIRQLYRYDPATNRWATLKSAPHYHKNAAGGVINGKFYVAGGTNNYQPTANLDVYDPATNTWKTLAPLPSSTIRASGAVISNKLFVVAWSSVNGSAVIKTYSYDPVTNKWTTKASPPTVGALARVGISGKSYVISVGGTGSCCDSELPSQLYTP
jgi:N-acetylneuraminic acid mutarotase